MQGKKLNKFIYLFILLVFILAGIIFVDIKTKIFTNLIFGNNIGITIGNNNNNFGYANKHGKWIYYMSLSKDANNIAINKVKENGNDSQVIVEKDWEIYSINAYEEYLYFIAFEPVEEGDTDTYQNNKIYKMSLDGKELRVINDNKFNDDCKTIYVVKNRIYYIGEDYNIYSMDLEGGDRKKVNDSETGFIGITNKYILYNDYAENPQSETDFVTYIMTLDGKNPKTINGKRLYNPNIIGNKIYYVNGDNSEIHVVDINGKNDKLLYSSPAYNMNVSDGYIYYLNYKNENADSEDEPVCIHRVKLDGTEHEIICEMENYSSFINIAGDWIYYADHNDDNYFIKMIRKDGSESITLYEYKMKDQEDMQNNEE